jgi:hypothetical protein
MEADQVLLQRDWTDQELLENGFRYYERRRQVVMARELPSEEAPLSILYGDDTLIATAGYMVCFLGDGRKRENPYDYHHWPVAPDHFTDLYRELDDPTWKPNHGEKQLMSFGCKPYYNVAGVWAKKLTHPQWIQNPEQNEPFKVPAGTWLIICSIGSARGVPMWSFDEGFKRRFIIK